MARPWSGRLEDPPFVTGAARYLADVVAAGGYEHVAIIRSPVAHGTWRSTRREGAEAQGTVGDNAEILDLDAFASLPNRVPIVWRLGDQTQEYSSLADPVIRYVGQPVGLLIGPDPTTLADAIESVEVDIEERPPVATIDDALAPGAPRLHADRPGNILCDFTVGDPADEVEARLAEACHVVEATFRLGRVAGVPLEGRGLAARMVGDRLEVITSTQAPHAVRDALAAVLGWPRRRIRVTTPAIGGGFGVKDHPHDDELLVAVATAITGRALAWTEGRHESLTVTTQARDERHHLRLGLDGDGRFVALDIDGLRNGGAHFAIFGGGPLFANLGMLPGPYRFDRYHGRGRVVATTTVPTAAYRGFGQTQATYLRERLIDLAAAATGIGRLDLRRRNLIAATDQPYTTRAGLTYDNGDYAAALVAAEKAALTWPAPPDDGRRYGIGYAPYVQMSGIGSSTINAAIGLAIGGFETASIEVDPDGEVSIDLGTVNHGQGHATSFARLVADRLGVTPDQVRLATPDTDHSPYSPYGTAASRTMAVGGAALVTATDRVAATLRAIAADELEAAPVDIELVDGMARVAGGGGDSRPLAALARRAWQGRALPDGCEPGLHARIAYDPVNCTFGFGVHVCRVAVDPDTGQVAIDHYHVVQDCGTVIEPVIVEGQTHGAMAQGAGAALLEEAAVDDRGQPTTGSLLSYLMPGFDFLPTPGLDQTETPAPHTPGGMKGIGEGGTNGAFAAVANAVADALPEVADQLTTTPLSPQRVWRILRARRARASSRAAS
ncbi:MAG: xanthine dehydrogenase family protein molybdopterin-binding subunit [Actinomycetota bacterium]